MLVFVSIGSGKTRFLSSMVYHTILTRAGRIYVDGKGDTTVLWLLLPRGQEDDYLVVNYLTEGGSKTGKKEGNFEHLQLTDARLRSLLVGLIVQCGRVVTVPL